MGFHDPHRFGRCRLVSQVVGGAVPQLREDLWMDFLELEGQLDRRTQRLEMGLPVSRCCRRHPEESSGRIQLECLCWLLVYLFEEVFKTMVFIYCIMRLFAKFICICSPQRLLGSGGDRFSVRARGVKLLCICIFSEKTVHVLNRQYTYIIKNSTSNKVKQGAKLNAYNYQKPKETKSISISLYF